MKSARVFKPAFAAANKVEARRDHDAARRKVRASRRWYGLKLWQVRRSEQLAREPLCRFCRRQGLTVAATVADHVDPHNDDWEKLINGDLQSLCKPCHDGEKQRAERFADRMKMARRL
jgi:5-methylcytosine-specific restriction enzyme A